MAKCLIKFHVGVRMLCWKCILILNDKKSLIVERSSKRGVCNHDMKYYGNLNGECVSSA